MRAIVVLLAVVGLAAADVSHGYRYSTPHNSYGVPIDVNSNNNAGYSSLDVSQHSSGSAQVQHSGAQQGFYVAPSNNVQVPLQSSSQHQSSAAQVNSGFQSGNGYPAATSHQSGSGIQSGSGYLSGGAHQSGSGYQSGGAYQSGSGYQSGGAYQSGSDYQSDSGYQTGSGYQSGAQSGYSGASAQSSSQYKSAVLQKYQEYYNQQLQQPAQVFKHFYVHSAPEEPEQPKIRQLPILPPPQKHYKVIFIKTPAPPAPAPQFVPIPPQNEEKTIVYVLVKKPEEVQEVVLPKVEPKQPTKPEVFFIKYSGKEDSQAVINNIVDKYNNQQGSVSFSGGEASGSSFGHSQSAENSIQNLSSGVKSETHYNNQAVSISSADYHSAQPAGNSYSEGSFSSGIQGHGISSQPEVPVETYGTPAFNKAASIKTPVPHQSYGSPV